MPTNIDPAVAWATGARTPETRCPVDCGRYVRTGHLLCGACLEDVPPADLLELQRTRRDYTANPTDAHWFAYVEVREAIIDQLKATRC